MTHKHDWEPMPHWCGRYRCAGCAAIGYKNRAAYQDHRHTPGAIVPYLCSFKVDKEPCGLDAIGTVRGKDGRKRPRKWYCKSHVKKGRPDLCQSNSASTPSA